MPRKFYILSFLLFALTFSASADTLGQGERFFISPIYDAGSQVSVTATLRYVSDRAYFYIDNDYWSGISEAARDHILANTESLAKEFDSRIHPIETEFFGSEPNPGIDNDPRTTILLIPLIENAGGYFDTTNEYSRTAAPNSNQREMIYLNINELNDQAKMFAFLAHEFQHLISFNQKEKLRGIADDIWLNELRSEYAPTLLGYDDIYEGSHLQRRARALISDPSDSLTEWKNMSADYGQIGLFGEYIGEKLSPQVISETLKTRSSGINSLGEALAAKGFSDKPLGAYRDWLIANFLNDTSVNPKFGYSRGGLSDLHTESSRAVTGIQENTAVTISDSIKDWQGRVYDISQLQAGNNNTLRINFDSFSLASFYISYLIFKPDGQYQLYDFSPAPSSKEINIPGIGTYFNRIVLIPIKKDKLSGFSSNETPVSLTISLERVVSTPPTTPILNPISAQTAHAVVNNFQLEPSTYNLETNLPDGSLIRARGDYKVYVINGSWRRHIVNSRIFSFYPGLGFEKVIEVDPAVLNQYQKSSLVRYAGSQRVYEVDASGARQWLNMGGEAFNASGRSWEAIFMINSHELNYYLLGRPILK